MASEENNLSEEKILKEQIKELSKQLDEHLKKQSKDQNNELFYAANAEKLHMRKEVEALKSEITTHTHTS